MHNLDFALVIHNHQPVDNDDKIIEQIYRKSYKPFLKMLSAHQNVKANLHYTGSLLDWLELHHPDFIRTLKLLVDRGQVEIVGGTHYEPVIPVIPDEDAKGQIALLDKTIRRIFGRKATGFWTAERAWEPQLPEVLERCGLGYTLLDDDIFAGSGIAEKDCFRPYIVESRGSKITVFPMLKKLRYFIPFRSATRSIAYLKSMTGPASKIAVYADDGEKFGAWPTTYERVYREGWLESFFRLLEKESTWLRTVTLSDYLSENHARERTYLGSSSYPELMEWSLPPSGKRKSSRGFWRLFLAKYQESARMYERMLRTSRAVHKLGSKASEEMLVELWKGQCNDAYWHGIFGGLYAAVLRRITQSHLIGARALVESATHGNQNFIDLERTEFNGFNEILVNTRTLGVLASPSLGGSLVELDYKPKRINFFDTLRRRREEYHEKILKNKQASIVSEGKTRSIHDTARPKEEGLHKLLAYDKGPKHSFLDHFFKEGAEPVEDQTELVDQYGNCTMRASKTSRQAQIRLARSCAIHEGRIHLQKSVTIPADEPEISVEYGLKHESGNKPSSFTFSPEINLGSLGDTDFIKKCSRPSVLKQVSRQALTFPNAGGRIDLEFEGSSEIWQFPVKTVSQSESGYESNLQGVSIMPIYRIDLSLNQKFETNIRIRMS